MRLPRPQFLKLVGPHKVDPQVFGLKVVGYDGAPHLEVADRGKLQQTLWALETLIHGDRYATELYGSLQRLSGRVR